MNTSLITFMRAIRSQIDLFHIDKLILLLVAVFFSMSAHSYNRVYCNCEWRDAFGAAYSACSAYDGYYECGVWFNEFEPGLESGAVDLANKSTSGENIKYYPFDTFSKSNSGELARNPKDFVDMLLVYMLVSVAASDDSNDDSVRNKIRTLRNMLSDLSVDVAKTFNSGAKPFKNHNLKVNSGCVEFEDDKFWVMYKTEWSAVASEPQCGDL